MNLMTSFWMKQMKLLIFDSTEEGGVTTMQLADEMKTCNVPVLTTDMLNFARCSKCLAMSVASTRSMTEVLKVR